MAKILLQWSNATPVLNNPIQGYEIEQKLSTDSVWDNLPFVTTNEIYGSYEWNGALFNQIYDFRIRTKYILNNVYSGYKAVTMNTSSGAVSSPITNSVIIDYTNTSLEVQFYGASDIYGIIGYKVAITVKDEDDWTEVYIASTNTSVTKNFRFLEENTDYTVRAIVVNVFNNESVAYTSDYSTSTFVAKPFTDYEVVSKTPSSVEINFSKMIEFTPDIMGYNKSYRKVSDLTWTDLLFSPGTVENFTYDFTDLTSSTSYVFRANIVYVNGVSNWFTTDEVTTDMEILGFGKSSNSLSSSVDACSLLNPPSGSFYCTSNYNEVQYGDRLYTNSALTAPFNGENKYHKIGYSFAADLRVVKIDNSGYINEVIVC